MRDCRPDLRHELTWCHALFWDSILTNRRGWIISLFQICKERCINTPWVATCSPFGQTQSFPCCLFLRRSLTDIQAKDTSYVSLAVTAMMLTFLSSSLFFTLLCAPNLSSALPSNKATQSPKLKWQACDADYGFPSDFQCTQLEVPVDWKHPNGDKITLFMNKAPATNSKKRIGSLILNPGG